MQQGKHIRKAVTALLMAVIILAAGITSVAAYAEEESCQDAYTNYTEYTDYTNYNDYADNNDYTDNNGYTNYTEAEVYVWGDVDVAGFYFTGTFYGLRLISVYDGLALGVISTGPEGLPGGDFFATSANMTDWVIISPAVGWYVYYDGYFYWYMDGLYRTSDWREDWQFHPTPHADYQPLSYEYQQDSWEYIMALIFDNNEDISEITFIELSEGGILRIERLPFTIDNEIVWVGFAVMGDADQNPVRTQLRLFVNGWLVNSLAEDAESALVGLDGFGWARDAIMFIVARDLMDMYACPTTGEYINFNPTGGATRGDVLAAAVKALGLVAPNVPDAEYMPFDDVLPFGRGAYIDTALQLGLVAGIGNNNFAPDRPISRQDMMTMLYNILLAMGQIQPDYELTALGRFRDIGQIASYARLPISSLARAGIIAGDGININPRGYMSRVEAAMFVWNLYRMN